MRMKRSLLMLAGLGMAVGIILGGLNMATAQETPSTTPTPTPETKPVEPAPAPAEKPVPDRLREKLDRLDRFGHGRSGFGFGPGAFGPGPFGHKFGGGAIHGEFTTKAPDGGFRTQATQLGEVTTVSPSSITVKSEDGFSRTYAVNEDTLVNAGRDGVGSVKTGDQVQISALVEGDTARAVHVFDTTNVKRLRERWWPKGK
jgi:hypothetical protein